jgi:hypothetical protein
MDQDTRLALLAIGVPILGLLYCGLILAVMLLSPDAREHPIIMATIFSLAPSIISGSVWLRASAKARNKDKLGL